jgi:hypothetical protein
MPPCRPKDGSVEAVASCRGGMILKKKGGEKNEIDRKSGRVKEKA